MEDHPIWPWAVMYSAMFINICLVGEDGRTPYERRKGRRFKKGLGSAPEAVSRGSVVEAVGRGKAG